MVLAIACAACGTTASLPSAAPPTPVPTPSGGEHQFRVPGLPQQVTATLPAGWQAEGPVMSRTTADEGTPMSVSVWVVKAIYADPCHWTDAVQPVGRTAAKLAAALAVQPMRHARPSTVKIGDHTARMVTMSVPEDLDLATCDDGEFRSWPPARGRDARSHQGPGQVDEVFIIDLGRRRRAVVDAAYFPDADSGELAELHRIVASLRFGRG